MLLYQKSMNYLKLFLLILIFNPLNGFTQNIEADYAVKINSERRGNAHSIIETLGFKLIANKNEVLYKINNKLQIKNELEYQLAKSIVDGFNEYYVNFSNKETIIRKEFFNEFFIIKSKKDNNGWDVTKQTKVINKFTCYKAIKIIQQKHHTGKLMNTTVIAWFCPEINYPFGPVGFHGLPGLILELHKGKAVHYLKKIQFGTNTIAIVKPSKGTNVTEKEFNEILKDFAKNQSN